MLARLIAPPRSFRVALTGALIACSSTLSLPASAQEPKAKEKAKAPLDLPPKTLADVPYGDHPRQVIDFWKADTKDPAPLAIFIHGGGWNGGDKGRPTTLDVKKLLESGVSVAAINYRLVPQAREAGIKPPVKWPLEDAARAIQFLRSKATEWNIDKTRLGANGGSAGACSSLWLAMHDDMARPDSSDPIARESTRLACAAVVGAQTALDPHQTRAWMPNMGYGGHAFGFPKGEGTKNAFQVFYEHRDEVLPWLKEYSPYEHAGPGDPPVFLDYPSQDKPAREGETQKDPTHSAVLGLKLQEKLKENGVEARLSYPGHKDADYADSTAFLIAKLKPARP
jgi:acetyl esterase/lipase